MGWIHWVEIGTSGGLLWTRSWTVGSHKLWKFVDTGNTIFIKKEFAFWSQVVSYKTLCKIRGKASKLNNIHKLIKFIYSLLSQPTFAIASLWNICNMKGNKSGVALSRERLASNNEVRQKDVFEYLLEYCCMYCFPMWKGRWHFYTAVAGKNIFEGELCRNAGIKLSFTRMHSI